MRALGCRQPVLRCERSSGPSWDAAWPQRCGLRLRDRGRWPPNRRRSQWEGRQGRRCAELPRPETSHLALLRCRGGSDPRPNAVFSHSYCRLLRLMPPPAIYSLLTMTIETEIKFRVEEIGELVLRLREAGFKLDTPRAFESNVLYDTPNRDMRAR